MNKKKLKILMLAAECAPIAKVGGLGDVVGALPKELEKIGLDVRIILPFYGLIDRKKYPARLIKKQLAISGRERINLYVTKLPGSSVSVYLLEHRLFAGKYIYRHNPAAGRNKNLQDGKKFSFYCRASLVTAKYLGFQPDVIHIHDWHAAPTLGYLKSDYRHDPFYSKTKTLYTIHNLANQGKVGPKIIGVSKLDPELPVIKVDLKDGDINFMVQGILGADLINTVSPTYAKEILSHYQGAGLERILKRKRSKLSGIINGIDTIVFNPEKDRYISQRYSAKKLFKKKLNKLILQKELKLEVDPDIPLVGLISRLVWQKGLDLVNNKLMSLPCQFVFLGTGSRLIEKRLLKLAKKYPKSFSVIIGFDPILAQKIYAGSDLFLMPSRFEPCGLGQLIAMRYGTIPLVRSTGGLADTVNSQLGFSFNKYDTAELYATLKKALNIYNTKPKKWLKMQNIGMKKDLSWKYPAREYFKIYMKLANIKIK